MPSYNSRAVIYGKTFLDTVVAALKTVPLAALIVAPKVRLSKDPSFNPSQNSVIGDFTTLECNFSGYTSGGYALTMSAPVNLGAFVQGITGNVVPIAATASPFVGNNCYGYWIDDGTNVILGERFADGLIFAFGTVGDFLDLGIGIPLGVNQPAM